MDTEYGNGKFPYFAGIYILGFQHLYVCIRHQTHRERSPIVAEKRIANSFYLFVFDFIVVKVVEMPTALTHLYEAGSLIFLIKLLAWRACFLAC